MSAMKVIRSLALALSWITLAFTDARIHDLSLKKVSNLGQPTKAELEYAISIINSAGMDVKDFCDCSSSSSNSSNDLVQRGDTAISPLRLLSEETTEGTNAENEESSAVKDGGEGDEEDEVKDVWFYVQNGTLAFLCVTIAALAAGLTMGLVNLEELDLRIKEMAANSEEERHQARTLLPLIQDHHRLLVTLLLMNAVANEALPLFLDELVPSYAAVIISVTLVLFFGEIIPSAIFSGPQKLAIATKLAPMVKIILFLLCPLAWPIGKVLDKFLHDENEEEMQKYDRKEIGALVRIQYEERVAAKMRRKALRRGESQSSRQSPTKKYAPELSTREIRHLDTVHMVEGALAMHSITATDVMTKLRDIYSIPNSTTLDESSVLEMYRRGHSRIPVYDDSGDDSEENKKTNILGIFKTKQLMVVDTNSEPRPLSTMPLMTPHCVANDMTALDLLNKLQAGVAANKGGQLAIVCMNPDVGNEALSNKEAIPDSAGVIGIVTLEDCLEELIQEEIYDEYDQLEKEELERATWAVGKWKAFINRKKEKRDETLSSDETTNLIQSSAPDYKSAMDTGPDEIA